MMHSRLVFAASLSSVALLIASCTTPTRQSKPITLLAFGDGGYHYDHLDKKAYEKVVTEEQFMAKERKDWVEERRPPEEFDHPPMYMLPGNGSVIPASGQMPTAAAMKSYCAQHTCDFAVMLGDNIYPDGAMADADDARRFRDVFTTPYGSLVVAYGADAETSGRAERFFVENGLVTEVLGYVA